MRLVFLIALLASSTASLSMAQIAPAPTSPSTDQMIEQLISPRTRSLRNLQVEGVPATPATTTGSSAPPAASMTAPEPRPQLSLLIQFDFDSARVRPESLQALGNLATALQSNELRTARFAIEGHTDGKGRADYNFRLSQLRADAVSSYLASQGVSRERLQASGKGATDLANRADPAAAENRRVRIINLD